MAIKDFWIYQKRDVPTPWALYVVKEYDKRYRTATTLDWTLYHEDIPNQLHQKSFVGLHAETVKGYVDAIAADMADYVSVETSDYAQLQREVERILLS